MPCASFRCLLCGALSSESVRLPLVNARLLKRGKYLLGDFHRVQSNRAVCPFAHFGNAIEEAVFSLQMETFETDA
jgi:hypothetical protein